MTEKVSNFDEMRGDLARLDPFQLSRIPTFEPRRGPAVPSFITTEAGGGLLFMPVRGGPSDLVEAWLAAVGGEAGGNHTQNSLRAWLRKHPNRRSFTVLRHPLRRAWVAFTHLLGGAPAALRQQLRDMNRVALPPDERFSRLVPTSKPGFLPSFWIFCAAA